MGRNYAFGGGMGILNLDGINEKMVSQNGKSTYFFETIPDNSG